MKSNVIYFRFFAFSDKIAPPLRSFMEYSPIANSLKSYLTRSDLRL